MNIATLRQTFLKGRPYSRSFTTSPAASLPKSLPQALRGQRGYAPAHPSAASQSEWPTVILAEAARSGFLKVDVATATQILDTFGRQGTLSADQLCRSHNVKPNVLTVLARILSRSERKKTAQDLLIASARLGDDEAILLVIKQALKSGELSSPRIALVYQQHFRPMLQRSHPAALYLEGQKSERERQFGRALEIYEGIVAANTEDFDAIGDISFADIWKAIGKMRAQKRDRKGAEAAIRTAALKYDDSGALFQLAKNFIDQSSTEYESFMLKAAASGEPKAAHELGVLYFRQSQSMISTIDRDDSNKPNGSNFDSGSQDQEQASHSIVNSAAATGKRQEAQEWFNIGAESGLIGSQVYFALLLRESGKLEDGLQWLTLARNPEDVQLKELGGWTPVITYFASRWHESSPELKHIDIDSIRKVV